MNWRALHNARDTSWLEGIALSEIACRKFDKLREQMKKLGRDQKAGCFC